MVPGLLVSVEVKVPRKISLGENRICRGRRLSYVELEMVAERELCRLVMERLSRLDAKSAASNPSTDV